MGVDDNCSVDERDGEQYGRHKRDPELEVSGESPRPLDDQLTQVIRVLQLAPQPADDQLSSLHSRDGFQSCIIREKNREINRGFLKNGQFSIIN